MEQPMISMALVNDPRPATYGANANDPMTACSSENVITTRDYLILRHHYDQSVQQIECLVKENRTLLNQYQTLHMLYIELKYDRNRIARLFNTAMRELVHMQRTFNSNNNNNSNKNNVVGAGLTGTASLNRSQRKKRKRRSVKNNNNGNDNQLDKSNLKHQQQEQIKELESNKNCKIPQILSDLFVHVKPSYCNFENLEDFAQPGTPQQPEIKIVEEPTKWSRPNPLTEFCRSNNSQQHRSNSMNDNFLRISKSNLMYPNLLHKCVEFSRSLINLSNKSDENSITCDNKYNDANFQIKCDTLNNNNKTENKPNNSILQLKNEEIATKPEVEIEEAIPIEQQQTDLSNSLILNFGIEQTQCNSTEQQNCRLIKIKLKSNEPLGLMFDCALQNGVVVKQVAKNSAADGAGICPGDRVLEVCGINMREVNFELANKILNQCKGLEIVLKVLSADNHYQNTELPMPVDNNLGDLMAVGVTDEPMAEDPILLEGGFLSTSLKRTCTLTRREAFKKKHKAHSYFERKHNEQLMLHQSCHLTVTMPRRINVNMLCLAQIKLLGGNAVGIFVHSIINQYLTNILQTGDQLLEYNNFDLTKATAEDAAIELAKPATDAVLVAYFNIEMYNQIRQNSLGDSFYIRTLFARPFTSRSLSFQKGDIFYIDNTMYEGKPGYWRAWRVDEFGEHTECGLIPSKYTAECELLKQSRQQEKAIRGFRLFKFLTLFSLSRLFTSRNKKNGYSKLNDQTRVLASFSYPCVERNGNNATKTVSHSETVDQIYHIKSYQMVRKVINSKPRPVLIFGPLSYLVAEQIEHEYPTLFRQCTKMSTSTEEMELSTPPSIRKNQMLHCTHTGSADGYQCISLTNLNEIIEQNFHPVIPVVVNTIEERFHQNGIYPIVIAIKFRSAKHIKETVNLWDRTVSKGKSQLPKISFKMAKVMFEHMLELGNEFRSQIDHSVTGNNLTFMCTKIMRFVDETQSKARWVDIN